MQLWKKSFIFVFVLVQSLLFCGLLLFVSYSLRQDLTAEKASFERMVASSDRYIVQLLDEGNWMTEVIHSLNLEQQFYLEVASEGEPVFSSLPFAIVEPSADNFTFVEHNKESYLYFHEQVRYADSLFQITYLKNSTLVFQDHYQRMLASILLGLGLSFVVGVVLYWQMKKIYRPIQNLAHELRSPLTLISGYSELILRTKQTEAERLTMAQEIYNEANHLQATIEQLLIMGDLKEGDIAKESIYLSTVLQELSASYPKLDVNIIAEEKINGNRVLLTRLLINLLDNACRASSWVKVFMQGKELIIENDGEAISANVLIKLNKGRPLLPTEYHGTGQGFHIAREIVELHDGTIQITSDKQSTKVRVSF